MQSNSPWPHIVVDDFLSKEDFKLLSAHPTTHVKASERQSLLNNQVFADGSVITQDLSKAVILGLHDRYHGRSMDWLRHLAPKKVALFEYADYELVITGKDCKHRIHDDSWDKLLSIVVYLAPEKNTGTIVYDNMEGRNPAVIEWKRNRALVFARREGQTWHAYKGDGINNRLALVYNLMTSNRRGVYQAEGINYSLARARKHLGKIGKLFGSRRVRPE